MDNPKQINAGISNQNQVANVSESDIQDPQRCSLKIDDHDWANPKDNETLSNPKKFKNMAFTLDISSLYNSATQFFLAVKSFAFCRYLSRVKRPI
ncbi:MAG: hypothetical protein QNJ46_30045 [Leptolyngbyaceae cyanobacterium MO_188.B28]|nr:hypothetical protein [Leptolyngbyaceae cyanobacterium MO_188.B28]